MATETVNIESLTDEEFMALDHHAVAEQIEEGAEKVEIEVETDSTSDEYEPEDNSGEDEDTSQTDTNTGTIGSDSEFGGKDSSNDEYNADDDADTDNEESDSDDEPAVNPEEFYKQVISPFKAAGKTIQVKSPEEAVQLMQMGADYTRKMQDIAAHKKVLLTLQQNDLLDESKLNLLIDIQNKNPEAIKQLLKDADIDPWDLTSSYDDEDTPYQAKNYIISDEEARLTEVVQETLQEPLGQETLNVIRSWDVESKDAVAKDPSLIKLMREQKESGIFDTISEEIDRLSRVGTIAPGTPFIEAYVIAGNSLSGGQVESQQTQPTNQVAPQSLGTRVGSNRPIASQKAKAAAPPRKSVKEKQTLRNPLALTDEDFLKSEHLYRQYMK